MNQIFKAHNTEINYNGINKRAEIKQIDGSSKPNSIAMVCFKKNGRGLWDRIQCFWLKNFSWNWIKVNKINNGSADSTQLVNMASISRRLGIKPKEIHKLNKAGTLYDAICKKNEELNAQIALKLKIDDFKKNEIQNSKEYNKIQHHISEIEDNTTHDFAIFFNSNSKNIEVSDKNHKSYMKLSEIEDSYKMEATVFREGDALYISIGRIGLPMNWSWEYSGDEANLMRQEVLDIYKSAQ